MQSLQRCKTIVSGSFAVALGAAVIAPGAVAADTEGGNHSLTVLVCCASDPADQKLRNEHAASFMAAHPGVKVTVEYSTGDYFAKLNTMIAGGVAPDVFDMWEGYVQPYAKRGVLEPLDPYFALGGIEASDFAPALRDLVSYDGRMYALPLEFQDVPVVYYNPALLANAGVAVPGADWTWAQLRTAAQKLTLRDDKTVTQYGVDFGNWYAFWLSWIWSNGGDVFNAAETASTAAEPPAVEAVQFWADLIAKDGVAPTSAAEAKLGGGVAAFTHGKVALYEGAPWEFTQMRMQDGGDWGVLPPPVSPSGGRATYLATDEWAIYSGSKHKSLAWAYVTDYLQNVQAKHMVLSGAVPAYKPLVRTFLDAPATAAVRGERQVEVSLTNTGRYPGAGDRWEGIAGLLQGAYGKAFAGRSSVAQAIEPVIAQIDARLQS